MQAGLPIRIAMLLAIAAPAAGQPGIGTCVMGEARNATFGSPGNYAAGATIYQWFDPAGCGFCVRSGGAIRLMTLELEVYSSVSRDWPIDASVSVIGWKGSADCPEPDESVVVMPAQPVSIVVPGSGGLVRQQARATILNSPLLVQPAFLKLEFAPVPPPLVNVAVGQVGELPCTSCRQYITSPPDGTVMADVCSSVIYPWTIRPRGDCVAPVETRPVSWGRLKTFYK